MSLTTRILLSLALGLAAGAVVAATQHPTLLNLVSIAEPVGTLWLNALRMTIIPLVMSLLVTGIATLSAAAAGGRIGARTMVVVVCMLAAAGLFTALAAPLLLAWFPVNDSTAAALRSALRNGAEASAVVPTFGEWISGLVPANPIEAAAAGAMLPLVVFSLLLGIATTRLSAESRERLLGFFRSLGESMMVIVQWVLALAPIGVFALMFSFGVRAGVGTIGAMGHYVLLLSGLCVLITLMLYPVTALLTRVPMARFARAAAPAQAVAFSTRSSLASLPAMLDSAQVRLGLPSATSGLVLPLTVTLMRITSPTVSLGAAIFGAALFGIALSPALITAAAIVAVLISLGEVGLPGQVGMMTSYTPIFLTLGVPLDVLPLMLAVETIPDTFGTVGNVTGDMAVLAIVAHGRNVVEGGDVAVARRDAGALEQPAQARG